ncbi:MAG: hypothetical protein E6Z13_09515, partial [Dermabacter sp.]|nr:hypothetical protein [Dermabacter sp.]
MNFPHTYLTSHFVAPDDARGIPAPSHVTLERRAVVVHGDTVAVRARSNGDVRLWMPEAPGAVFLGP